MIEIKLRKSNFFNKVYKAEFRMTGFVHSKKGENPAVRISMYEILVESITAALKRREGVST